MSDYPDPDEELELMYGDDLELMRETEALQDYEPVKKKPVPVQAKRSLDFTSPASKKPIHNVNNESINKENNPSNAVPDSLTQELQPMSDILTPQTTNKRNIEDLFGDINDIDFEDINQELNPNKKQKTEEECDFELISKILEERKLKQMLSEPSRRRKAVNKSNYDVKENLSLDIPRWSFLPITNSDGTRIYVKFESEEYWEKSLEVSAQQPSLRATYDSVWKEARKILEEKQQREVETEIQSQPLPLLEEQSSNTDEQGSKLWVEKYKPQSYVDLLSEEPVNRALLHWLHLWDKIVFKKDIKVSEPTHRNTFNKRLGSFELTNRWRGKKQLPELDDDGRPHHKVALLCGPPGVGKTTLAHLLARLAGYRPVEVNASDERSTESFRTVLQSATQMKSVIDADKRPNCLILDEIDGAPLPTIELLVRWCTASVTSENSGKKKNRPQPLKRPIIAICNDLYATSLRPLRAISLIIHVGGVSQSRLSSRLLAVCARERLEVGAHVVTALSKRASGDVRAAIQLLNFVKDRAKAQLSMEDVMSANIGTKDCSKGVMQALQSVFSIGEGDSTGLTRTISSAGEWDRSVTSGPTAIAEGIFENYPGSRADSRLLLACECLSYLCGYDLINTWTRATNNYVMYSVLPMMLANCRRTVASRNQQKNIRFPMQAQEVNRRKTECEAIFACIRSGCSVSTVTSRRALRLDVVPILPYLLAPRLRTANLQLCSDVERSYIYTCAGAMCDYGLQYVQEKTDTGYAHVLEPNIHKLAFFGSEERVQPPPVVRQAIAREQQLEMIRRCEIQTGKVSTTSKDSKAESTNKPTAMKPSNTMIETDKRIPNHLQRLKPKDVERSTPQVHKDFFGRIVPLHEMPKRSDGVRDIISSSEVFYQYREGFNNAVRKTVRMRDLM